MVRFITNHTLIVAVKEKESWTIVRKITSKKAVNRPSNWTVPWYI